MRAIFHTVGNFWMFESHIDHIEMPRDAMGSTDEDEGISTQCASSTTELTSLTIYNSILHLSL